MKIQITATHLRANSLTDPDGVLDDDLRFSWVAESLEKGARATSCHVQVAEGTGDSANWLVPVWDSGSRSAEWHAAHLVYDGPSLAGLHDYSWRVRLCAPGGELGEWSYVAHFVTAPLGGFPKAAQWVAIPDWASPGETAGVQYLRRDVGVRGRVVRAKALVSALGWYRLSVNGIPLTSNALVPGFTAFESRVEYQSYDLIDAVKEGSNTFGLQLADGRFRGRNGGGGARAVYGEHTAVIAYFEFEYDDGSTEFFVTDESWIGGDGEIVAADPKDGEKIDHRRTRPGWDSTIAKPDEFTPVTVVDEDRNLVPVTSEKLRAVSEIAAVTVTRLDHVRQLVDFGSNLVGMARLNVTGNAGDEITLDFGEVLTPAGDLDRDYLAIPGLLPPLVQRDVFILAGSAEEVFEPSFTIHGFRYVEISGHPGDLDPADITAVVYSASLDYTGSFSCSDSRVNALHENIRRSMRSNFTDIPTDCPTRERSGWTGDTQVFARTATLLAPVDAFLSHWLTDLALQQAADGKVPDIVPRDGGADDHLLALTGGAAGWGDAAVLVPWILYERFGDRRVLERQYDSMVKWVEFSARRAAVNRHPDRIARGAEQPHEQYLVDSGFHWGEWLEPGDTFDDLGALARVDASYVATAYFANSSRILGEIAELLGRRADAARFRSYFTGARRAWREEFLAEQGRIIPDKQASYVRALRFGLLEESEISAAQCRLAELVEASGRHVGTGFLSTGFLLDVLSDSGRHDLALDLLLQKDEPSWLAQVEQGATSIWESWSGYDSAGYARASHNHYSLGAVAAWFYENLAGIRPLEPGWRRFEVVPYMTDPRISSASARTMTPYGEIAVDWVSSDGHSSLSLDIPVGSVAVVRLPVGLASPQTLESGHYSFAWEAESTDAKPKQDVAHGLGA